MQTKLLSAAEQVADRLRDELIRGRWSGTLPGIHRLSTELGFPRKPIEQALLMLEKQGLLVPQGVGRRRRIELPKDFTPPALRVKILHYQETDRTLSYVLDLQHGLMEAGHSVGFASRNLLDLGMDAKRVARMVKETETDAWVVFAGPREVLEWFASQPVPSFAMFGRRSSVPIAGTGPDKLPALLMAVRRLVALGHRKIVMLLREEHRKPQPGPFARAFLDELKSNGLSTGSYNLPDWEDSGDGFRRCLDSLFQSTPPSALILDEAFLFNLAQLHLARRGILAPEHVSLICSDPDPAFGWAEPSVAHIRWESRQVVRRIVRWADNVARGKDDRRQTFTKAEFIEGGTVGVAPRSI
jgi:DNA-binding LacI/PurR family transcriptional regulator